MIVGLICGLIIVQFICPFRLIKKAYKEMKTCHFLLDEDNEFIAVKPNGLKSEIRFHKSIWKFYLGEGHSLGLGPNLWESYMYFKFLIWFKRNVNT